MQDMETQKAVERIQNRGLWFAGWLLCISTSLMTGIQISVEWHTFGFAAQSCANAWPQQ